MFNQPGPERLTARLGQYYCQSLLDRSVVIADARQFDQVFSGLDNTLSGLRFQIQNVRAQMQVAAWQHEVAVYNALVPN